MSLVITNIFNFAGKCVSSIGTVRIPGGLSALIVVLYACLSLPLHASVAEPEGYRLSNYDDLVPDGLSGATTVSALQVLDLQQEKNAVVIDVIPEHRKPENLPEDQQWFPVPHLGIAGALWLPDVGYGVLSEKTEAYFTFHLEQASDNNADYPLVFYCRINCWMSWNAAKRALSLGYRQVHWFSDGLEDWQFEGFETQLLEPAAGERH